MEWAVIHKEELFLEWRNARDKRPLFPIAPLEVDIAPEILYSMAMNKPLPYWMKSEEEVHSEN